MKKTIRLERFKKPDIDKIISIRDMLFGIGDAYPSSLTEEPLKTFKDNIMKEYDNKMSVYKEREESISKLLNVFWRVSGIDYNGNKKPLLYMFPYLFLKTNDILFTLSSPIESEYNNNNGLHEQSYSIFSDYLFKNYDLIFEETTKEEMLENAKTSCEQALNSRLNKINKKANVLN